MSKQNWAPYSREELIQLLELRKKQDWDGFARWCAFGAGVVVFVPLLIHFVISTIAVTMGQRFKFPSRLSEFGDSYGIANAIVTTLAFVALIYTLRMQREDLDTQQALLMESIKEMNQTAEATAKLANEQETSNRLVQNANKLAALQLSVQLATEIGSAMKRIMAGGFIDATLVATFWELCTLKQENDVPLNDDLTALSSADAAKRELLKRLNSICNRWQFESQGELKPDAEELVKFVKKHWPGKANYLDSWSSKVKGSQNVDMAKFMKSCTKFYQSIA